MWFNKICGEEIFYSIRYLLQRLLKLKASFIYYMREENMGNETSFWHGALLPNIKRKHNTNGRSPNPTTKSILFYWLLISTIPTGNKFINGLGEIMPKKKIYVLFMLLLLVQLISKLSFLAFCWVWHGNIIIIIR